MDPVLYEALTEKLQSLGDTAVRMNIPEDTSPTTMKNRILRVSSQLEIPVTIRRVPGGLLFWRTTDEDLQPAKPVVQPLPNPQPSRQSTVVADADQPEMAPSSHRRRKILGHICAITANVRCLAEFGDRPEAGWGTHR